MLRGIATCFILFVGISHASSQFLGSPERTAIKSIEQKRWDKVLPALDKALRKDSLNVPARYLRSVYFFQVDNPDFHLDSAYQNIAIAIQHFGLLPVKLRERFVKFPLDSVMLVDYRAKIDSASFQQARTKNTEQGYLKFLQRHPFFKDRQLAMELRDEVAYLSALETNTHEAFLEFIHKYPKASKIPEAQKNYERLLYEASTSDKRLLSYEKFLRDHPETPFRTEIEKNIFELFTLSGEVERFLSFLQVYPKSAQVKKAQDILFHLLQDSEEESIDFALTDSLQNVRQLLGSYLIPTFRNGKFGFIDKNGKDLILPHFAQLPDEYKCGNITEDVLALPNQLMARNGKTIYKGTVEQLDDLGSGYLKVQDSVCSKIIHKSGFFVESCAQDAKMLGGKFIAVKSTNQWTIFTLAGRPLGYEKWSECSMFGNAIGLKQNNDWLLFTLNEFIEWVQQPSNVKPKVYDEIKPISDGQLWVRKGNEQGVLDPSMAEIVPMSADQITNPHFRLIAQTDGGYFVYSKEGKKSRKFEKIRSHQSYLAIKEKDRWALYNPEMAEVSAFQFDSVRFEGPFIIGLRNDSLIVRFQDQRVEKWLQPVHTLFIQGKDSTSFLTVEVEGVRNLYSISGQKLFSGNYDHISDAGSGYFIVSKKEKKGLVNTEGKMILPIEYDAIGTITNGVVSLLKSMKFGLFNVNTKKLIKPAYDKNLVPFNTRLIAVYKDGLYGFIDWNSKPASKIEFTEINYWNDSLAFVKKNSAGMFYALETQHITFPHISKLSVFRDTPEEKIAIVQQDGLYGVISNKRGVIVPISFTDLVNLGPPDDPLYFTEKHVEEAWLFVVIYYDKNGRFLRREVYEEPDDYEKIYCPDN